MSSYKTAQWYLGTSSPDQENAWMPKVENVGTSPKKFPLLHEGLGGRGIYTGKRISANRSTSIASNPDRIITTTKTTQTIGKNYTLTDVQPPLLREIPRSVSIVVGRCYPDDSSEHSAFSLDLRSSSGSGVWDMLGSNPSLDIIEDYQDDDLYDLPRRPPSSLPQIPCLPPPSGDSYNFNPRKPRNLEELESRGLQRQTSADSTSSNDPLAPDAHATAATLALFPTPRTLSATSAHYKPKKSLHQKNMSQSRLLPLHLNQAPYLTHDKPVAGPQNVSILPDKVKLHWALLIGFALFPPMWLVLASGAFDRVLHVPAHLPVVKVDSLAGAQRREYIRIRRVKQIALVLGATFWTLCLVGFLLGLTLA